MIVAGTTTSIVLAPILAPAVLGIVGFGAAGPVAGNSCLARPTFYRLMLAIGTLAAAIQAGMGNVAAGSAFAVAQSVAMGGALPAVGYVSAAAIGAGLGGAAGQAHGGGEAPGDEEASDDDEAPKAGKTS